MIDRKARDTMVKATRAYMDEQITAFQFGDAVSEACNGTRDDTVHAVATIFWCFYDDCKDHEIIANKEEWDLFCRLLLLLESDAILETVETRWKWHAVQGAAALLLLGFMFLVVRDNLDMPLLVHALPFGPPSLIIAWLNVWRAGKKSPKSETSLIPFDSVITLLKVRRSVPGFVKKIYPRVLNSDNTCSNYSQEHLHYQGMDSNGEHIPEIHGSRNHGLIITGMMWLCFLVLWCMFAPAVLFFQMLPKRESITRIKLPDMSVGS